LQGLQLPLIVGIGLSFTKFPMGADALFRKPDDLKVADASKKRGADAAMLHVPGHPLHEGRAEQLDDDGLLLKSLEEKPAWVGVHVHGWILFQELDARLHLIGGKRHAKLGLRKRPAIPHDSAAWRRGGSGAIPRAGEKGRRQRRSH